MATMFRKSTAKRNFRRKILEEDEKESQDDNPHAQKSETGSVIKVEKVKAKAKIEKVASAKSLLSFDHDHEAEEDSEIFQVKKSKESRKLSKKVAQEKKKKDKSKVLHVVQDVEMKDVSDTDDQSDADKKLEALRAELNHMSKLDENEDDDDDESEGENDGTTENSRSGLAGHQFSIPDAATIHALKKKRELARQLGGGQDFIPLEDTQKYSSRFESAPRLVREDENDVSDDEDGPINFSVGGKTQDARIKRQEMETALGQQEGDNETEDEDDEEMKRWEEEQIRKGVSVSQIQHEQEQPAFSVSNEVTQGQFSYDQSAQIYTSGIFPYGGGYGQEVTQQQFSASVARPSMMAPLPHVVTMETVWDRMNKRLTSLQEVFRAHSLDKDKNASHLETAEDNINKLEQRGRDVERRFGFYQEMRGYVRDLIECLSEKVPIIEAQERSIHGLLKQRADRFVERRQEDVKDQAAEFLNAQMGKQSNQSNQSSTDQFKQRRAAEREGRRTRRRRQRELNKTYSSHHDGMSTDDEETEADSLKFKTDSERIIKESQKVFHDVVEDFSSIDAIKVKFEEWKRLCSDSYKEAYIALCLPKLLKLFVRIQLLGWIPFDPNCKEIEEIPWFGSLVGFGFSSKEDIDPSDDDVKIIPGLIEKAIIPKLTGLFEYFWDPLFTNQTICAVKLIQKMAEDYPTVQAQNKATQKLFSAIVARMRRSVNDDVYVPLYPKSLLESKSSGALSFFQRQFWSCYKLFSNILIWHGLVSSARLQELALDGLLNRYLLLGLQHSSLYFDSLDKCKSIIASLPKSWLDQQGQTTLPSLEAFARFLVNLASCMQRSSAGCSEGEKKKARSGTKKIIQLLLQIKSVEKAKTVASEYNMKDLVSST